MTSVLRRYAQIDPQSQNVIVIADANFYEYDVTQSILSSPVMSYTDFKAAYGNNTGVFPAGALLKDMGRFIHVYDPTIRNNKIYIFRQMMEINGATVEGISDKIGYVCTWASSSIVSLYPLNYVVAQLARIG